MKKYEIKKLSRANVEITEAYVYYEIKLDGLGERFIDEVDKVLLYISQNPYLFPKKYLYFRQAPLKVFPFIVIFSVENTEVLIHSVFNTYQNPLKKP